MNEKSSKRREWIKTAAIIFLSIMLVLTFFSQTILNHSLPEVATNYVQSGTITTKIRGSGVVESGDPYTIEVPGVYVGRKVSSIKVKVGDKVEKGDVLLYLLEGDGAELEAAKEELKADQKVLESAQDAYDTFILSENITSTDINSANANMSTDSLRKTLSDLQTALNQAKDKAVPIQTSVDQLNQAINDCNAQIAYEQALNDGAVKRVETADIAYDQAAAARQTAADNLTAAEGQLASAQQALSDAGTALDTAKQEQADLEIGIADGTVPQEEAESRRDAAAVKVSDAEKVKQAAEQKVADAQKVRDERNTALSNANTALQQAANEKAAAEQAKDQRDANPVINNLNNQIANYELSRYGYQKELDAITGEDGEIAQIQEQINSLVGSGGVIKQLQDLQDAIDDAREALAEQQKKVDDLQAEVGGSAITADISGTVTEINVASGKTIQGQDVMVLQPEGQGYFMTFSVTNDQAKTLSVGDQASLVNSWYYNDLEIVLKSIKPDQTDPGRKKMLTFSVNGDATVGQNISVSVGQKSQNYDLIVPNSAIKEDNNGKFILIVESKSSPVGNRYIATRVDVQVLASDDTQSAISGAISGWEYVITTSSKPINPGDQVRMTDN